MKSHLRSMLVLAAVAASLILGAGAAMAASISIFGTGLDAAGNPLAAGASDPHYTVSELGDAHAVVAVPHPSYFANNASSQWVWPQADGYAGFITRTFVTTFDLTGFDISTAVVTGFWGTDNFGDAIRINGISIPGVAMTSLAVGNFSILHEFTIATGFVQGLNTLEFVTRNDLAPGGFRVQLAGTATVSAVPLPAALPLFAAGLGLLGAATWRRRHRRA